MSDPSRAPVTGANRGRRGPSMPRPAIQLAIVGVVLAAMGVALTASFSRPSPGVPATPPAAAVASPPTAPPTPPPSAAEPVPASAPPSPTAEPGPSGTPTASGSPGGGDGQGDTGPSPTPVPPKRTSPPPEALAGKWAWPVKDARITTWFAPTARGWLMIDGKRVHNGLDLASHCGDEIHAVADGVVVYEGRRFDPHIGYSSYPHAFYRRIGNNLRSLPVVVVLDHGNGYRTVYAHVRAKTFVKAGEHVKKDQVIAQESDTGRASGCHLHFEIVRMDGRWVPVAPQLVRKLSYPPFQRERIDPMRIFRFNQPGSGRIMPWYPPPKFSPGFGRLVVFGGLREPHVRPKER